MLPNTANDPAKQPNDLLPSTRIAASTVVSSRTRIARLIVPLVLFGGMSLGLAGVAATTSFAARPADTTRDTARPADTTRDTTRDTTGSGTAAVMPQPVPEPEAMNAPLADEVVTRSATGQPSWMGTYPNGRDLLVSPGTYTGVKFDGAGRSTGRHQMTIDRAQAFRTSQRAVFHGDSYFFVTSGPMSGYWMSAPYSGPQNVHEYRHTIPGTLPKGDHSGVRFYSATHVVLRKQVSMPSRGTYQISRRGTFDGKPYVYFTTGPLAFSWVQVGALVAPASGGGGGDPKPTPAPSGQPQPTASVAPTPAPGSATTVWKTLVLIYRETDVHYGSHHFTARISDSDLALQVKTVKDTAPTLREQSNGLVTLAMDVVLVDHPLTRLDEMSGGNWWFGPSAAKPDMDRYAPNGKYDSIITIWQAWNRNGDNVPTSGWGLTVPPGSWANGAGYTAVLVAPEQWWITGKAYPSETFVHEWLHQSIGYFEDHGYHLPDLHRGEDYGYHDDNGSWMRWYRDMLQGKIHDGGGTTGIKPAMWTSGQPTS